MTATKKQRARRIASDEAHAWARSLDLRNPMGKSVLRALANYCNGEGSCFVGLDQLSEDTDLSVDTVRRRLIWLEQIGALVRLAQWRDANGVLNKDGRGKRTTDEVRLLIDADIEAIEAAAHGETRSDVDERPAEEAEFSPSCQLGLNPDQPSVSPRLALAVVPGPNSLNLEPESPPLPPSGGAVATSDQDWKEFERDWDEPILRQSIAQQVWAGLKPDERQLARRAARGYVAWRKAQRKPPNVIGAHLFLRERDAWPRYAELAPDSGSQRAAYAVGSVAAKAIAVLHDIAGRSEAFRTIYCSHGQVYWHKPVTPQLLRLAEVPAPEAWVTIGREGAGSWEAFMRRYFDDDVRRTRFREGARAPWAWPPSTEGKLYPSAAGPPPGQLSEQDAADLK